MKDRSLTAKIEVRVPSDLIPRLKRIANKNRTKYSQEARNVLLSWVESQEQVLGLPSTVPKRQKAA